MAIKDLIKSLTGKKELPAAMQENAPAPLASDAFPVYRADELDLSKYRKIPLASLAAMGAAFSQLPEEARMVMGAMKGTVGLEQPMFRAINLHGATGWMKLNDGITSGRIFRMNEQGQNVYSGQMYFKEVAAQEMSGATSMVMPIDPVTMAIAVALFSVEQKLGDIQAKVEEVLRFLKLEKQSQQRGNLKMLSEIMAEFKRGGMDEQLRTVRMNATQAIRRDAHKDMLFYQEQISTQLGEQKAIHSVQQAQHLQDQVMGEFCEYQLACHLYAYSTMLETVLHGTYAAEQLAHTVETMQTHADRLKLCRSGVFQVLSLLILRHLQQNRRGI